MPIWFRESWTTGRWTQTLKCPVPGIRNEFFPFWAAAVTDWLKEIKDEAMNYFEKPERTCKKEICQLLQGCSRSPLPYLQLPTSHTVEGRIHIATDFSFIKSVKWIWPAWQKHLAQNLHIRQLLSISSFSKFAIHKSIFSETRWILKLR